MVIDDIVILQDHQTPPTQWKLGRVTEAIPDKNGKVRTVKVKQHGKDEPVDRACGRLVPLCVESEEPEAPLQRRRSPRNHMTAKAATLATTVLLCWLSLVYPASSLFIQSLSPGVHIQKLGNVSLKAFDLNFTIATSLDTNRDFGIIDDVLISFRGYCNQFKDGNITDLLNHCTSIQTILQAEVETIKTGILEAFTTGNRIKRSFSPAIKSLTRFAAKVWPKASGSYQVTRPKRWVAAAGKAVTKGVIKIFPHAAMVGVVVHQELENSKLEQQIDAMKNKVAKVSTLITNIQDLEYTAVEGELDNLISQQQKLQLMNKINSYSSGIFRLSSSLSNFPLQIQLSLYSPSTQQKNH